MSYRQRLLDGGVRALKEFGYPHVNADNICTDLIFRQFFLRMLEETLEDVSANRSSPAAARKAVEELIAEVKANRVTDEPKKPKRRSKKP